MTSVLTLANARIVLPNEVVTGSVTLHDGLIRDVEPGKGVPTGAVDCEGDYLVPGLIELHTDNLERHIQPRPGVAWPHHAAIVAHDAELASVGITTVFDAIRVGSNVSGKTMESMRYARSLADEIARMRTAGALRISHHLHLRAEVCSETLPEEMQEFGADDRVGIVSLMDHTPGQRQFRDMDKYKAYTCGKRGLDPAAFDAHVAYLTELRDRVGSRHEAAAISAARRFGATLASHDDTTEAQVLASAGHGMTLAEFPTTVEAARACRAADIAIIMGAPNLVRGASHSGNVAAQDLAEAGQLDILSSDYVPAALLLAATRLADLWDDMPRAMATVTATPARRTGLTDRGRIAPGLRADLVRFRRIAGTPVVLGLWSAA